MRTPLALAAACAALAASLAPAPAAAQLVMVDGQLQTRAPAGEVPARGQSMAAVEQRFGAPTQRVAPVGSPPIARWEYPAFVVYFEGDRVIHTVAR